MSIIHGLLGVGGMEPSQAWLPSPVFDLGLSNYKPVPFLAFLRATAERRYLSLTLLECSALFCFAFLSSLILGFGPRVWPTLGKCCIYLTEAHPQV